MLLAYTVTLSAVRELPETFHSVGYRDSLEDKSKANLVQIKGRFSVTSQNVDLVKVSVSKINGISCILIATDTIPFARMRHHVHREGLHR